MCKLVDSFIEFLLIWNEMEKIFIDLPWNICNPYVVESLKMFQ